jgi:formylglycine-generating enzyme required for sulfatase activity
MFMAMMVGFGMHAFAAKPPSMRLSAGGEHTCAVMPSGALKCWGSNSHGQAAPPSGMFQSVSAGYAHTCAIATSGRAECWGGNEYGESRPPQEAFDSVSAGFRHSCGITSTGKVKCWGDNRLGQALPPRDMFKRVRAGQTQSCGVTQAGAINCWGKRPVFDKAYKDDPTGDWVVPDHIKSEVYQDVAVGRYFVCGLTRAGTVLCWGPATRMGDMASAMTRYFTSEGGIGSPGTYTQISSHGWGTLCALPKSGIAKCMALSFNKGYGKTRTEWRDVRYHELGTFHEPFISVSAGNTHACGVMESGEVVCIGGNQITKPAAVPFDERHYPLNIAVAPENQEGRKSLTTGTPQTSQEGIWGENPTPVSQENRIPLGTGAPRTSQEGSWGESTVPNRVPSNSSGLTNSIGMNFVKVGPGTFTMGCQPRYKNCGRQNYEEHTVTLTEGFLVQTTEVTLAQYFELTRAYGLGWEECGTDCPVSTVSWYDAVKFANALSKREGLTPAYKVSDDTTAPKVTWDKLANGYRLLTEAEWEYVARAGETTQPSGTCKPGGGLQPVASLSPNGWGVFDMPGSLMEWTYDADKRRGAMVSVERPNVYTGPTTDPHGTESGWNRVVRGEMYHDCWRGFWANKRRIENINTETGMIGFRLARTPNTAERVEKAQRTDAAKTGVLNSAASDFAEIRPLLKSDLTPESRAKLKDFMAQYGDSKITVGSELVPGVFEVSRALMRRQPTPALENDPNLTEFGVEYINKVVLKYQPRIQSCYTNRLKEDPTIVGDIDIEINVDSGRVIKVRILRNTTLDRATETCMVNQVRRWQFSLKKYGSMMSQRFVAAYRLIPSTAADSHEVFGKVEMKGLQQAIGAVQSGNP